MLYYNHNVMHIHIPSWRSCSKMVDLQDHRQEDQGKPWVEQVEDLWTAKLKHLWDLALPYDHMFQFDPGAGEYGLYGYHWGLLTPTFTEEESEALIQPPSK